jgi:probable FeS assembly SUF system protein SufT
MNRGELVYLQRDTKAYMVPSGAMIMLHEGTELHITQQLGESFTVNVYGNLARIEAKDADALGKELQDPLADLPEDASLDDKILVLLKQVYDPEIPVNIVDLGLVYTCDTEFVDDDCFNVNITMTLTAPGCGMGPVIAEDVKRLVSHLTEVQQVEVEFVFDPPWDRSMMSEAAQLELGMM